MPPAMWKKPVDVSLVVMSITYMPMTYRGSTTISEATSRVETR